MRVEDALQRWSGGDLMLGDELTLEGFIVMQGSCWVAQEASEDAVLAKRRSIQVVDDLSKVFSGISRIMGGGFEYAFQANISGTIVATQDSSFPLALGKVISLTGTTVSGEKIASILSVDKP